MTQRSRVLEALGTVYDPELDEPITDIGFDSSVVVAGGAVAVRLRHPTPQCAPTFAFLMAADATRAIWLNALSEPRLWLNEGRDFRLDPPQAGKPVNTMIIGYAEIDGVPARVLPDGD